MFVALHTIRMKPSRARGAARRTSRLMVSVNEAVARGLSLCPPDLGLQGLSDLCRGGDTISLLRLFHYFPYGNVNGNDDGGDGSGSGSGSNGKKSDGGDSSIEGGSNSREDESGGGGAGKIGSSPHTDW